MLVSLFKLDRTMSLRSAVSGLVLLIAGAAQGQSPTSGAFVTMLGSDTFQIERYA